MSQRKHALSILLLTDPDFRAAVFVLDSHLELVLD